MRQRAQQLNVASACVADSLRNSKAANLSKVVALLREHETDLAISSPPIPEASSCRISGATGGASGRRTNRRFDKLARLQKNIEHINDIVAMQQNYAKTSGVLESLPWLSWSKTPVRMNVGSMERNNVKILREYSATPLFNGQA